MSDQLGAWQLILNGDANLFAIVRLSLAVSLSAVALAAIAGLPLGALLALSRFPGRSIWVVLLNALMGLPPVVHWPVGMASKASKSRLVISASSRASASRTGVFDTCSIAASSFSTRRVPGGITSSTIISRREV